VKLIFARENVEKVDVIVRFDTPNVTPK